MIGSKATLDIPVFHDDQHGTAIVALAALLNAVKVVDKRIKYLRVLIIGLGAAGVAVARILQDVGVTDIIGCDLRGAVHTERVDYLEETMSQSSRRLAESTNPERHACLRHRRHRPADRRVRSADDLQRRAEAHGPRPDRLRDGQSGTRDHP